MLVVAGWDKIVRVYDVSTLKLVREFYGSKDQILAVAFSYDGNNVASGGTDSILRLYSLRKSDQIEEIDESSSLMDQKK